jgi:hypothetical protein
MTISYAITVCNEEVELQKLVDYLAANKRREDEIVILFDKTNGDPGVEEYLRAKSVDRCPFTWFSGEFDKNFSTWKNKLTSLCKGDYIVNIDADEVPSDDFQENIVEVLEGNPEVDVFVVPRWNTVAGLTQDHIKTWRWSVDDLGRINWPDYQMRVYKNNGVIKWINPVHEVLSGFNTFAPLPDIMYFNHHKTIEKQVKQNSLYSTL